MENYTDIMETLIAKHSEKVKELEEKIALQVKKNEDLKKEKGNRTKLFEFLLTARKEKCDKLEEKLSTMEGKGRDAEIGTILEESEEPLTTILEECEEPSTTILKKSEEPSTTISEEREEPSTTILGNVSTLAEATSMEIVENLETNNEEVSPRFSVASVDETFENGKLSSTTFQNSCDTIIDPSNLSRLLNFAENSNAKMERMVKNFHSQLSIKNGGKWYQKSIKIERSDGNKVFIVCPECFKRVSATPKLKMPKGKIGNFSINQYKRHIAIRHCKEV